ncbi:LOW QUALITY PROTEIN: sigma-54 dependent transcriptional regulator [Geomicrobium sp. JCM 19039]|nr:LOW QUALITY PROTEIN: sigma-54 dependent transcriptional regulator [Geomicrobium sp. JCM 19039]
MRDELLLHLYATRSREQPVQFDGTRYRTLTFLEDEDGLFSHLIFQDDLFFDLYNVVERSYDGISMTDVHGVTKLVNGAVERYTGIPREYFLGKSADRLVTRGFLQESVTAKVLAERKPVTVFQGGTNDQQIVMTGSPLFNDTGEIQQVVINFRDISELVYLYQQHLQEKQVNDYSGERAEHQDVEMQQISSMVKRVANVDATVLFMGETGVGKDVFATELYERSRRSAHGDFIKVNCGAIPMDLLESELFGYEDGAFSGAKRKGKPGMFELADKGVLFLDEVGELPSALQVKLLRVLQDGEIRRIGGTKTKFVDVRIVSARTRIYERWKTVRFEKILYYRLNVLPIKIPPLRERKNDIDWFAQHFMEQYSRKYRVEKTYSEDFKIWMRAYHWPGNIRELANLIQRLVITVPDMMIDVRHLPADYAKPVQDGGDNLLKKAAENAERELLERAFAEHKTTYEVARALNSSQATVARKMKNYGINV